MIIVPIEENHGGIADLSDARFTPGDYSGSGLEALGAGLAGLGNSGQQFAAALDDKRRRDLATAIAAAHLDDAHRRNLDDAAAKKAYVAYSDEAAALLHGDNGILNHEGVDAHAAFPAMVAALADSHDNAMASLDSVQRGVVAPALADRLRGDVERAAAHVREQGVVEQQQQSKALQQTAARDAVFNVDDPDLHDHYMATGENALRQQSKIENRPGKDLDRQLADYKSGVHADTIEALAAQDPARAAEWYAKFGDNLNEADKNRVEATFDPALPRARAPTNVDAANTDDATAMVGGGQSDDISRVSTNALAPLGTIDPQSKSNPIATVEAIDPGAVAGNIAAADSRDGSPDPYNDLRKLVARFPGGGELQDANSTHSPATPPRARPDLAAKWTSLSPAQRLQDPELINAARAVRAAETLLDRNDPELFKYLGLAGQVPGNDVKSKIKQYLERLIVPRALTKGVAFNPYSDQELQAGGGKAGLLYGALREANARALNHRQGLALHFFIGKGWSNEQAAAIVGNLTEESGLDPGRQQENQGKGYGLAQWDPGEPRALEFERVMHRPLRDSSFEQQLQFVDYELQIGTQNPMRKAGDQLKLQKDVDGASRTFTAIYERPKHTSEANRRVDTAKQIYQQFDKP